MTALTFDQPISPEEYLKLESQSEAKHEYFNGQVYAMAGARGTHNIISGNLYILWRDRLQQSPCQTYFADMKVRLGEGRSFFYPDVVITCDERDDPTQAYVDFPRVVIEVLSDSTESYDRGKKFQEYRTISSLQAYILVSSQEYLVEIFRRTDSDLWLLQTYEGLDATLHLENPDLDIPLSTIYATLNFSK
ncbi:MAG: Uma2 family endonuclease [Jaaginema sp. PMC 1079.18]|nr:Uma2 family endonuclease [Jaaginema sp. PMC 1080.18]MEC4851525.1 Uma2 family endonuclease [Jaaginema sp. PMC 1079.18]MEC4867973.1 Uma2 family endonuclease [Jaaginema sp. PMC 1078.18]